MRRATGDIAIWDQGTLRGMYLRRRGVGKKAPDVIAGDYLHEMACFDVSDFHERGLESQNVRIM